jgi:hypothetical protein
MPEPELLINPWSKLIILAEVSHFIATSWYRTYHVCIKCAVYLSVCFVI